MRLRTMARCESKRNGSKEAASMRRGNTFGTRQAGAESETERLGCRPAALRGPFLTDATAATTGPSRKSQDQTQQQQQPRPKQGHATPKKPSEHQRNSQTRSRRQCHSYRTLHIQPALESEKKLAASSLSALNFKDFAKIF